MWSRIRGDQIRILDILPHGGTDDASPICCEITVAALSKKPRYEAVSYCWGVSNETVDIEVAGNPRSITTNLQAALRHLRLSDRKRSVWIDQICVNQDDNEERLSQVHLMNDIYSKCSRCLAWLGEIDSEFSLGDAKAALDLILFISDEDKTTPIPTSISSADTPTFKAYLRALASVGYAKNPWWKRIWTVQEAILPSEIIFHWGPLQIPWGRVVGALHSPIYKRLLLQQLFDQHGIFETWPLDDYRKIQHSNMIWIKNAHVWTQSPFEAAIRWRSRQATVPHDKVFGLRGLWNPNFELPNTDKCSYETSVSELYSAFTMDIILDENSLRVLTVDPRVQRSKRTRDIPNWAMDLNDSVEDGVDMHHRYWGNRWFYCAYVSNDVDKQALLEVAADPNHHFNVLGLTGIMIDTVDVLSPVNLTKEYFNTLPNMMISQMLRDWMDLARSHSRPGPFNDKIFYKLVVGDVMRDSEQRRPNENELRQMADFVQDESRDEQWPDKKMMCAQLLNQKFFVTKGGMMGLGHLDTEPGDEVWVFDGGEFPFLVKRQEQGKVFDYDFVGCCYMQDIVTAETRKLMVSSSTNVPTS